jgi:molybdopterin molybdotransferase
MTRDQSLPTVRVTMRDRYDTPAALTYFARVRLTRRADGGMDAHLAGGQGSNLLRTMALADALLVIPERESAAEVGRDYEAILLP